ncbi:MAG: preprotein translocase subunit SecG [Microgenomates group bacterium]
MKNFLLFANIIVSIFIVVFILMQGGGAGLGSAWGGGGEKYQTRRGFEKILLWLSTIVIFLFFVISLVNLFVK